MIKPDSAIQIIQTPPKSLSDFIMCSNKNDINYTYKDNSIMISNLYTYELETNYKMK